MTASRRAANSRRSSVKVAARATPQPLPCRPWAPTCAAATSATALAGAQLYAATEEGIPVREIAETIGRHLGIPAASIPAGQAADHFKGFPFITMDITMPNADTRRLLGWEPAHPGLIADLDDGHYFTID